MIIEEINLLEVSGANVGIILIIFVAANQEKGLTTFINALFYVTAFYTIIFLYLYIVKGTFLMGSYIVSGILGSGISE